jgi:hypothetical protein
MVGMMLYRSAAGKATGSHERSILVDQAQQDLDVAPIGTVRSERQIGLEVQSQALVFQRTRQARCPAHLVAALRHVGIAAVEHAHAIAALLLGGIAGAVSSTEDVRATACAGVNGCQANAGTGGEGLALPHETMVAHGGQQIGSDQLRSVERASFEQKRSGIENFRWHDLRHTWASWHVQSGTPLHVLQELDGWASCSMVQRYAHLAADHLAPWAERLAQSRGHRGTNSSQPTDATPTT